MFHVIKRFNSFFLRKAILIQYTRCGDSRHQTSTGVFDLLAVRYLQYCARHCLNSRLKEVFGHWITNPSRRDHQEKPAS